MKAPHVGLSGQPFAGHNLAMIGHTQILSPDVFRLGEVRDAQGVREEFYGDVNVWDDSADLCKFESGDGAVYTAHICLLLRSWC